MPGAEVITGLALAVGFTSNNPTRFHDKGPIKTPPTLGEGKSCHSEICGETSPLKRTTVQGESLHHSLISPQEGHFPDLS